MNVANLEFDLSSACIFCHGKWTLDQVVELKAELKKFSSNLPDTLSIDASKIKEMDNAGGLFLHQLIGELNQANHKITDFIGSSKVKKTLNQICGTLNTQSYQPSVKKKVKLLSLIGEQTYIKSQQCLGFMNLLGELAVRFFRALFQWKRLQFPTIIHTVDLAGLQALPIVALLLFLIGLVLAYQMGLQLKTYGANIYVVYLTGMALQREFAPLITAIIVAGRTSSAFTAQLGSMKVNEEIDALTVMGLPPTELLVLPKVLAMIIVFPILIFWADLFGTLGAMVMAKSMLGIDYLEFVHQIKESLGLKQYLLGLIKAPVFALLIAMVGCFQGFQVKDSADSVGISTTKSVVQAIFLIIITDALFSIAYTWLGV